MTDLRRANEARLQKQHSLRELLRSSSNNSTPEPQAANQKTYPAAAHMPNGQPSRHPLLQALAEHANLSSTSCGSTTSSTATTATAATAAAAPTLNRSGGALSSVEMLQFDENEIYFVSPSKRKGSIGAAMPLRSSLRASERLRSFSPTTVAPSYPAVMPSPAYGVRTALGTQEHSIDNYDVSSHYSDTAMQLLRSGSCSGTGAAGSGILANNLMTATPRHANYSNGSLHQQQQQQQQQAQQQHPQQPLLYQPQSMQRTQNNVTFSNYVSEQHVGTHSNRGSLRRNKGRSNQSLCSCDAGADTEINPDPARPLYQYSLDRRNKTHTYTCEQNAQILMRLERERNRKLSLSNGSGGGSGTIGGSKADLQNDSPCSSDVDTIPPVPPPPSMKRNGSMRSLRLFQMQHQQQQQQANRTTISAICPGSKSLLSNGNSIAMLCNSSDMLNDCTRGALDISGSVIDDCTSSILKCANAVTAEIMATANNNNNNSGNKSTVATLSTLALHAKPDVCHVGNHATTLNRNSNSNDRQLCAPLANDDIYTPHTKKSDPTLCFLHAGTGHGPDLTKSQRELRQQLQQHKQQHRSLHKYNTIGPSSDYARKLHQYSQRMQQQQRIADRCRCLSQSLSNFPRDYFGQKYQQQQQQYQQQQQQQRQFRSNSIGRLQHDNHITNSIFHTSYDAEQYTISPFGMGSRSYSNLMDIDGCATADAKHMPYHKYLAPSSFNQGSATLTANGNMLNGTSYATLKTQSVNGGFKDKLSHFQQQQHHHHHSQPQHQHSPLDQHLYTHQQQPQQQQQHHAHQHYKQRDEPPTLQKHHQLHASVTSIMPWKHRQCPSRGSSSSGTNSFRFDAAKHWLAVSSILLIIGAASVAVPLALRVAAGAPFEERLRVAVQLLDQVPLIDGHNDLPWNIRKFLHNKLNDFNFDEDLRNTMPWARSHWSHTDLQRLKKGRVSAQFWAAYVPCEAQHRDAVQLTLEQIDVIKRLTDRYSPQLTTCTSSDDIIEAHKNHQLCSLTGVEGGHSLGGSLAVLRTLYAIGVRYMTLTSTCHTPWADSSYADAPTFNVKHGGLTIFGKTIIREMNRLGMMVDLSHVSTGTMRDALEVSEAPVIFSHSSAYGLCNSSRNVQDDMLQSLARNGGLVMVNFYSKFLSCSENSTVLDAVAHINHIKRVAGIDHVGLGAGYDGINFTPKGLEDVSSYPTLFAELLGGGWSIDDLTKLAGGNFLRVMKEVERIRDDKRAAGVKPYEDHPNFRTDNPYNCTSS